MKSFARLAAILSCASIAVVAQAQVHQVSQGWNLVGNDTGLPINPATIFGNASSRTLAGYSVASVWSWDGASARWEFFSPSLSLAELAAYAASRGYAVLSQIPAGSGFWINATSTVSLNLTNSAMTSGFPITYKGVRIDSLSTADDSLGRCRASLTFTNTTAATVKPYLVFDVVVGGVTIDDAIFNYTTLAGTTAMDTVSITDAKFNYLSCGTFSLRFNDASSFLY